MICGAENLTKGNSVAEKSLAERVAINETIIKRQLPLEFKALNTKVDNLAKVVDDHNLVVQAYHNDIKNGMVKKVIEGVMENIDTRLLKRDNSDKNRFVRIFSNPNFWIFANRFATLIMISIIILYTVFFGVDITSSDSLLMKIVTKMAGVK